MTKTVIAIIGLAGIEKARLTQDIADALHAQGRTVTILDNSDNNPMTPTGKHPIERVVNDVSSAIYKALTGASDIVLLNTAESLTPETVYQVVYDGITRAETATAQSINVRVLALADDRTCDCFPHLQALMEHHADLTLRYPFAIEEALAIL